MRTLFIINRLCGLRGFSAYVTFYAAVFAVPRTCVIFPRHLVNSNIGLQRPDKMQTAGPQAMPTKRTVELRTAMRMRRLRANTRKREPSWKFVYTGSSNPSTAQVSSAV